MTNEMIRLLESHRRGALLDQQEVESLRGALAAELHARRIAAPKFTGDLLADVEALAKLVPNVSAPAPAAVTTPRPPQTATPAADAIDAELRNAADPAAALRRHVAIAGHEARGAKVTMLGDTVFATYGHSRAEENTQPAPGSLAERYSKLRDPAEKSRFLRDNEGRIRKELTLTATPA